MTTEARIVKLVSRVCQLNRDSVETELEYSAGLREILRMDATNKVKSRFLFEPLMGALSFQGIGDEIVMDYMDGHGMISYFQIVRRLKGHRKTYGALCSRLEGFQSFKACGYRKAKLSCNNPQMLMRCPVRTHDLLKGVLNVKAYSFFFYIRDLCQGDLIGHFDRLIREGLEASEAASGVIQAREKLVRDFTKVFGVGEKLANMTLSSLLAADPANPTWVRVGQAMVAVDTLVHNFLHRTGILKFYQAEHRYGPACSIQCARVLDSLIGKIDARKINPGYPRYFPRFVQLSIWRFCSLVGQNICNGVKIKDSAPCNRKDICPVFSWCDHIPLRPKAIGGPDETLGSRPA